MEDLLLVRGLRNIWDEEFTDIQKKTWHGESGIGTFEDLVFESNKDNPDVKGMLEYCFAAFYYEILSFCGCGSPNSICDLLLDFLECFTGDHDRIDRNLVGKLLSENSNHILYDFMLYFLDSKGFTEHGTSIYGSWLTEEGMLYRELLKKRKEHGYDI